MKIGVMIDDLGASQASYFFVREANAYLQKNQLVDMAVFVDEQVRPCLQPNFAVFDLVECWSWDGDMIATSLRSVALLQRLFACKRKIFYVQDLEWLRFGAFPYSLLESIFHDRDLIIKTRSEEHAKFINEQFGCQAKAVGDWNWKELLL